jgi:uncharacterized membrane protein
MTDSNQSLEFGLDLSRVVYFSDAVFAIAMTVLALSLHIPATLPNHRVGREIVDELPSVFAYFLSFAVIGLYWLAHHRLFRYVVRIDPTMMLINLALLSLVAFVPFPTQVLGDHGESSAAVIFYSATMVVLGTLSTVLFVYAARAHLFRPHVSREYVHHSVLRALTVPVVFGLSIPVAVFDPAAAKYCWLALLLVRLALRSRYGSIYARARANDSDER